MTPSTPFSLDALADAAADKSTALRQEHQGELADAARRLILRTNDPEMDINEAIMALAYAKAACHPRAAELANSKEPTSTGNTTPAALPVGPSATRAPGGELLRGDVTIQEALLLVAFLAPSDSEAPYPAHVQALQMMVRRNLEGPTREDGSPNRQYVELDESGFPKEVTRFQGVARASNAKRSSAIAAAGKVRTILTDDSRDMATNPAYVTDGWCLTDDQVRQAGLQLSAIEDGLKPPSNTGGGNTGS